jgi:hypothetical protein
VKRKAVVISSQTMGYIVWAGSSPQSYGLFLASTAPWRSRHFLFWRSRTGSRALPYFAEIGYSLEMPEPSRFNSNCRAEYKVVRAEGDPPPDRQIEAADAVPRSKAAMASSSSNTSSWVVQGPKPQHRVLDEPWAS